MHSVDVGGAFLDKQGRDEIPDGFSVSFERTRLSARYFLTWKGARYLSLRRTDRVPYDELNREFTCVFLLFHVQVCVFMNAVILI